MEVEMETKEATKQPSLRVPTVVEVPIERVTDLLCGAFEGGSNYWYFIEAEQEPERFEFRSDDSTVFPHLDFPVNPGGSLTIRALEADEVNGAREWVLNLESVQKGLAIMAEKYPHHFADLMNESDDADTSDCFLQCCLFGEIVFG
jgi:hypothetical protein